MRKQDEQKPTADAGPVERVVRPGSEARPLVERLRSRDWADRHHRKYREEAADEIDRLHSALLDYFLAADAAWAEICSEAQKHGISSVPILPGQAKALEKYSELRRVFGPNG